MKISIKGYKNGALVSPQIQTPEPFRRRRGKKGYKPHPASSASPSTLREWKAQDSSRKTIRLVRFEISGTRGKTRCSITGRWATARTHRGRRRVSEEKRVSVKALMLEDRVFLILTVSPPSQWKPLVLDVVFRATLSALLFLEKSL